MSHDAAERIARSLERIADGVDVSQQLNRMEYKLNLILQEERMASVQFEALKAEVERNTSVDESIKALVVGLAAQIAAAKNDPVALQALADQLKGSSDSVADLVRAHTPEPEAPPAEPPIQ